MNRTPIAITTSIFATTILLSAPTAWGQNLSDRIDHVMQQKVKAQSNNSTKAQLLGTLLYTDITVQFNDQPARDVIKYLQTVLGINIVARYTDDRNASGAGIDPEQIITLDVTSKPGLSVLEMVLDQCSGESQDAVCTWQLRDGYVEVGPKERLSASRDIRYYPIRDLLFEAPHFDNAPTLDLNNALNQAQNSGGGSGGGGGGGRGGGGGGGSGGGGGGGGGVFGNPKAEQDRIPESERAQQIIDLITETVEPEAWESSGGSAASIRYYQGVLIVRAPDYIHRQIGGYPFAIRPPSATASVVPIDSRYVTFSASMSNVQIRDIRTSGPIGGTTGGGSSANAGPALPASAGPNDTSATPSGPAPNPGSGSSSSKP